MGLALAPAFASLGSVGAPLDSAGIMLGKRRSRAILRVLVSRAIRTLLGGAFPGIIPNALDREAGITVPAALMAGIYLYNG